MLRSKLSASDWDIEVHITYFFPAFLNLQIYFCEHRFLFIMTIIYYPALIFKFHLVYFFLFQILMHKTSRSPCTLMHHLYNTDILLTPHGFQSMLLLFLPRPGLMFEIFPEKYYKRGYGPFGAEYGAYFFFLLLLLLCLFLLWFGNFSRIVV